MPVGLFFQRGMQFLRDVLQSQGCHIGTVMVAKWMSRAGGLGGG
jgi:hypothetical protein